MRRKTFYQVCGRNLWHVYNTWHRDTFLISKWKFPTGKETLNNPFAQGTEKCGFLYLFWYLETSYCWKKNNESPYLPLFQRSLKSYSLPPISEVTKFIWCHLSALKMFRAMINTNASLIQTTLIQNKKTLKCILLRKWYFMNRFTEHGILPFYTKIILSEIILEITLTVRIKLKCSWLELIPGST